MFISACRHVLKCFPVQWAYLLSGATLLIAPTIATAYTIEPDKRISVTTRPNEVETEPTLAAIGDLVVGAWTRNPGGHRIGWGYSLDGGAHWVDGVDLPFPTGVFSPRGNPSLTSDGQDTFYLVGLVSGLSVAVWRGQAQGTGFAWAQPQLIVPAVPTPDGPQNTLPWDNPRIAYDPVGGVAYVVLTRIQQSPSGGFDGFIQMVRSVDQGNTWSPPLVLSGPKCLGGNVAVADGGSVFAVWQDLASSEIVLRSSADYGVSFGPPVTVGRQADNRATGPPGYIGYDRVDPITGSCIREYSNDMPAIVADRRPGTALPEVHVSWPERLEGSSIPITQSISETEPNKTYANANPVALGTEVSGLVMSGDFTPDHSPDGDTFYFDGISGMTIELDAQILDTWPPPIPGASPRCKSVAILCGADTLLGDDFARAHMQELSAGPLPPIVATLPVTGRYYIAVSASSDYNTYYQFQLRRFEAESLTVASDQRDIVIASSLDGGATWSAKRRVNADPVGFDESFPSLAFDRQGDLHVAWYGRRDDPQCGYLANTYWCVSHNKGGSFSSPIRLSSLSTAWNFFLGPGTNAGNHLGIAPQGDGILVAWVQRGLPDIDIFASSILPEPTAVKLLNFSAQREQEAAVLKWHISDSDEVAGFYFERAIGNSGEFERVPADIIPTNGMGTYQFRDSGLDVDLAYYYTLVVVTRSGMIDRHGPLRVESYGKAPGGLQWGTIRPNPFRERVDISIQSGRAGVISVGIFDAQGRRVRDLLSSNSNVGDGVRIVTWDGKSDFGAMLPSGMYFIRASQEGGSSIETRVNFSR